jgi:hypothetical protein
MTQVIWENPTELVDGYDITLTKDASNLPIQVLQSANKSVLWVNVGGLCVLRICGIKDEVIFGDDSKHS